jgi:hypothetical protein
MIGQKLKPNVKERAVSKRGRPDRTRVPWFKIGWGMLGGLLFISFWLWIYLFSYNVQEHCDGSLEAQSVRVAFSAPAFFTIGDGAEFLITVVNERNTAADLTVELRYAGPSLCCVGDGQSHRAKFGSVQPQERISRKIAVSFPLCLERSVFCNWPGDRVEFEIWLTVDTQSPERIGTIALPVTPVPKARTLGQWASGWLAGLALWIGKELWDQIKKAAGLESKSEA